MKIHIHLVFSILALGVLCVGLRAEHGEIASFSDRGAIEKRLEVTKAELDQLPESGESTLRRRLQQLEAACQYHLASVDFLSAAQSGLAKAQQEASSWTGFPQAPPYPVLLLDEVRETIANLERSKHTTEARLRIFDTEIEALRGKLTGHQQAERRFSEASETSTDPATRQSALQSAKMENLSARITTEKIGRRQIRVATEKADLAAIVARNGMAAHQLKAIGREIVFPRADLDGIQQRIALERAEVAQVLVDESKTRLTPNPLLTWKIEFLDLQKTFWDTRFAAIHAKDASEVRAAIDTLKLLQGRVDDWVEISELRIAGGDSDILDTDPALYRGAVLHLRRMQRLIQFAISDLEGWSLRGRGTRVFDRIGRALKSVGNAELYLVEESDIVDGKKIAIYRAITVGKLLRLALILVVGWFVLRFISQRVNAAVARRGKIPQATADLAGKWAFGTGLVLLLFYGLHVVSIPLTVFAFLGGALAIGIGFGTQTLLKNFISGIILLFERPLKIDDVIEVADIIGTVKFIGIRASAIQHFDGIETLVPNSVLLENQLTNWSFSNTVIRHFILVGVAYGSPTREVSRLLLAVATEHGLVKDDPAPEVRFDDFGENSLTFCLLFWLDISKADRRALASDLRFMIDRAFAEAGVVISFPQRDLHFDGDAPLRVELSRPPKPAPAAPPAHLP